MSEVFRCDYCGTFAALDKVALRWRWVEDLSDGSEIYTSALYCSPYCGRCAVKAAGTAVGS